MKKKLDEFTKCKLIYSGELLFFGVVMIVLGSLFLVGIIRVLEWKKWFFTIITLLGGFWAFIDFFTTLKNEKKRKKNSLLDKILILPSAFGLIIFDIIALINLIKDNTWSGFNEFNIFQMVIGINLLYVSLVFIFEAIYHYFHVHPMIYQMMEEGKEKGDATPSSNDIDSDKN